MDLMPSDEQRLLAESARAFVERHCPTSRVRMLADDPNGFDVDLWQSMATLGWAGIAVPGAGGDRESGLLELAVLCEALGRGPVPSPLVVSTTLAALPIVWAGSPYQSARWVAALAAGDSVGTLAIIEPGGRDEWDEPSIAGGATLRGTKLLVPWASVADVMVVATAGGLFLLEPRGNCDIKRHDDLGADPVFAVELHDAPAEPLGQGGHDGQA